MPATPVDNSQDLQRVRDTLRRAREDSGLTQQQTATELGWPASRVRLLETGVIGIAPGDLLAMFHLYGVRSATTKDQCLSVVQRHDERWFDHYTPSHGQEYARFLQAESRALRIKQCQCRTLPGLFQTQDYARAVLLGQDWNQDAIDRELEIRQRRWQAIQANDGKLHTILDEAVLRRAHGTGRVINEQLRHILELGELPTVRIQVIPFSEQPGRDGETPFTTLEDDTTVSVAFDTDRAPGDFRFQQGRTVFERTLDCFGRLEEKALPHAGTQQLIRQLLRSG